MASCEAAGGAPEEALIPAIAIEYVHTYSLIHDDLPAMDNAELRRGKPTCHKAYNEATAILAGDALLTEAFNLIARWGAETDNGDMATTLIRELAQAAGVEGMVSGQAFDLEEKGPSSIKELDRLHSLKTGAVIRASVRMGAIVAGADKMQLVALTRYAENIGLAFQIIDDLLDEEGETTGKDIGKDAACGKKTYLNLAGKEESRQRSSKLIEKAKSELKVFGDNAQPLAQLADYVILRKN
jgi:geranylgeranyl diphosphate synthase type II